MESTLEKITNTSHEKLKTKAENQLIKLMEMLGIEGDTITTETSQQIINSICSNRIEIIGLGEDNHSMFRMTAFFIYENNPEFKNCELLNLHNLKFFTAQALAKPFNIKIKDTSLNPNNYIEM